MAFLKKVFSIPLLKDILVAGVVLIGIVVALSVYLDRATMHDRTLSTPDLSGMTLEEAGLVLEGQGFKYTVLDSSKYFPKMKPRAVFDQDPTAGTPVKAGRRIYLKINRSRYEMIAVPFIDFENEKFADAERRLRNAGFTIGEITYAPHIGKDVVIAIRHGERDLNPGDQLLRTSRIDFVLGEGVEKENTSAIDIFAADKDDDF